MPSLWEPRSSDVRSALPLYRHYSVIWLPGFASTRSQWAVSNGKRQGYPVWLANCFPVDRTILALEPNCSTRSTIKQKEVRFFDPRIVGMAAATFALSSVLSHAHTVPLHLLEDGLLHSHDFRSFRETGENLQVFGWRNLPWNENEQISVYLLPFTHAYNFLLETSCTGQVFCKSRTHFILSLCAETSCGIQFGKKEAYSCSLLTPLMREHATLTITTTVSMQGRLLCAPCFGFSNQVPKYCTRFLLIQGTCAFLKIQKYSCLVKWLAQFESSWNFSESRRFGPPNYQHHCQWVLSSSYTTMHTSTDCLHSHCS